MRNKNTIRIWLKYKMDWIKVQMNWKQLKWIIKFPRDNKHIVYRKINLIIENNNTNLSCFEIMDIFDPK